MGFIDIIKGRAIAQKKTIVLPETGDKRVLQAASTVIREGIADIVLLGNEDEIRASSDFDLDGAIFIDPVSSDKLEDYVNLFVEIRKNKGMTADLARETLTNDFLYFGVIMVKAGDADGMVAGAVASTANVLRPSLQILKTAPGTKLVSAFFLMDVPNCEYGANGVFVFGDCGLNQDPSAEELAAIAGSSAKSFKKLVGKEPIVALLSHSTKGSAKHEKIDKVVEATRLAQEEYKEFKIDGEFQLDAAIVPEIGKSKAPDSDIAGKANVLVFPDLDAGNIGYKLVERLGKASAFGPLTQGIGAPVNDLSRGCSAEDIVGVVAITAVQATVKE